MLSAWNTVTASFPNAIDGSNSDFLFCNRYPIARRQTTSSAPLYRTANYWDITGFPFNCCQITNSVGNGHRSHYPIEAGIKYTSEAL